MQRIISSAELGNRQRNDRMFDLVQWLARLASGGAAACSCAAAWAMTMAAWRFLNNAAIELSAAYDVVRTAVRSALDGAKICFVAHDVSILDFTQHNAKSDRIKVGNHNGLGYEVYTGLVLDEHGRTVGPVFQEVRVSGGCHSSEPLTAREQKKGLARFVGHIEQMEKAVSAIVRHLVGIRVVHIADREFDDLQAMRAWMATGAEFILRVKHISRRVLFNEQHVSIAEACAAATLRRSGTVKRDGVQYRRFCGEIRVVLDGYSRRGRHRGNKPKRGEPIEVRIVVVELRARGNETIRWALATNVTEPAEWVVQAYVWRWRIERYFYLAKVGFKLEAWTQQRAEVFARKLALASLAAMVVDHLLALKEEDPQSIEAIRQIAALGGWLGRKHDSLGPIVLLRGTTTLFNAIIALKEIGSERLIELGEQVLPGFSQRKSARSTMRDLYKG